VHCALHRPCAAPPNACSCLTTTARWWPKTPSPPSPRPRSWREWCRGRVGGASGPQGCLLLLLVMCRRSACSCAIRVLCSLYRPPALPACSMLSALCADPRNIVYIISGRGRTELDAWFGSVVRLGWAQIVPLQGCPHVVKEDACMVHLVDSHLVDSQELQSCALAWGGLLPQHPPAHFSAHLSIPSPVSSCAGEPGHCSGARLVLAAQRAQRLAGGQQAQPQLPPTCSLPPPCRLAAASATCVPDLCLLCFVCAGARPGGQVWVEGHCGAHPAGGCLYC